MNDNYDNARWYEECLTEDERLLAFKLLRWELMLNRKLADNTRLRVVSGLRPV